VSLKSIGDMIKVLNKNGKNEQKKGA